MPKTENSIKRNKIILAAAAVLPLLFWYSKTLLHATPTEEIYFVCVPNGNTGELSSVASSLLYYITTFFTVGLLGPGMMVIWTGFIFMLLHIRDKQFFDRSYDPPYGVEGNFAVRFSFFVTYFAEAVLLVMRMFHLAEFA